MMMVEEKSGEIKRREGNRENERKPVDRGKKIEAMNKRVWEKIMRKEQSMNKVKECSRTLGSDKSRRHALNKCIHETEDDRYKWRAT